jgi:hypothetical protein
VREARQSATAPGRALAVSAMLEGNLSAAMVVFGGLGPVERHQIGLEGLLLPARSARLPLPDLQDFGIAPRNRPRQVPLSRLPSLPHATTEEPGLGYIRNDCSHSSGPSSTPSRKALTSSTTAVRSECVSCSRLQRRQAAICL